MIIAMNKEIHLIVYSCERVGIDFNRRHRMKEILKKEVHEIIKNQNLLNTLNDIGIESVGELCGYSRMELNQKGLANNVLNDLIIALQLNGVDLKPNHAKRNHLILK